MATRKRGNIHFISIHGIEDFQIVYGRDVVNSFPVHTHEKYCIGVLEKGRASFTHKNKTVCLQGNSIYFINPGEAHQIKPIDALGFSHIVFCFGMDFIKKYFAEKEVLFFTAETIESQQISDRFIDFASQKLRSQSQYDREYELIELLSLIYPYSISAHKEVPAQNSTEHIFRVCDYIQTHPGGILSLDKLSQIACLSRFHFCRLFKAVVGVSPYDYQIQTRIKKARGLLIERKPIADIAMELGFADQSHFSRFFKRNTGVTPAGFVKMNIRL
ncbi:MAG: AraC family transcriptional regulator [Clostridia bacterium]|nr:AraC family transcriptional regulator [Clostridia bacterium]